MLPDSSYYELHHTFLGMGVCMSAATSEMTLAYQQGTAWMTTSDGEILRTEIYVPENGRSFPTVLIRTPYSEPMQRNIPIRPLVDADFAVVIQYCRGTFGSSGELVAFENETTDGLDAIAWVSEQDWCDGRIAMIGASYLGMTQNAIAWKRPAGLVAMVQAVTTHDYRTGLVYQQGALQLGQGLGWHQLKTVQSLQDRLATGGDVHEEFARFGRETSDRTALYGHLPLEDRGIISDTLPSWGRWIAAEQNEEYWSDFNFAGKQHLTAAPALHIGGWYDVFLRGTLGNYQAMTSSAADPDVVRKQRLVLGPWTHTDRSGSLGQQSFPSGSENAINLEKLQIDYLRSVIDETDIQLAPVTFYVMGADEWRTSQQWPLADTLFQEWFLGADGKTSIQKPESSGTLQFRSDPSDPVPTVGGNTLISGGPAGSAQFEPGIRDRKVIDHRDDIVRWFSDPLVDDIDLIGPVSATIWTSADAIDADLAVHLSIVDANGTVLNLVDGYVRLKYRDGMDHPKPLEPDTPVEAKIDLAATARRIPAGSRLRVEIAGSNFPAFDRNSGSGKLIQDVQQHDLRPIQQTIFCGQDYLSRIIIPVVPHQ